ncbi:hypothetical protein PFISCL1PPCAC_21508 [Pristionchus fissidentatus]|uniref:Uncharacterized protein n=1 Tax=Pristionchus fissidentatus TaxID=1538716 RepID=A0AAV5WD61_9BILA|nr:hypothetical protein PFISCL1PPCAC_21508 [Pristionchus fissidentatus]
MPFPQMRVSSRSKRGLPPAKTDVTPPDKREKKKEVEEKVVDQTVKEPQPAPTKRAEKINQLGYFPLRALPDPIIVKILANFTIFERRSLRFDGKLDRLDAQVGNLSTVGDLYITTDEAGSTFRCPRYPIGKGLSVLKMDMKGILARMAPYIRKADYEYVEVKCDKSDSLHAELLTAWRNSKIWTLKVDCKYNKANKHSELSQVFTDSYLVDFVKEKFRVYLNILCTELTGEGVLHVFKNMGGRLSHFGFYVRSIKVVEDLFAAAHIEKDKNGKWKIRDKKVLSSFMTRDGVFHLRDGSSKMQISPDSSIGRKGVHVWMER